MTNGDWPSTEGLVLRPWAANDRDALVAAWVDPEVRRWTVVPDDVSPDAAARWIAGGWRRREEGLALDLVGVSVDDGRILGEVGLSAFDTGRGAARIGWWTAAPERGRGVATAMVRTMTDWAHDGPLALRVVVAEVDPANSASVAVAWAAGYELLDEVPDRFTDGSTAAGETVSRLVFASQQPAFGATGELQSAKRV
ncbi:MAG: GNAT family N-acetyltransferase [Actinomycetota bacterium]|nr:GNAT family N-acetyltransferase [Actinomycetota bacterium]MEC9056813.1 GNAT family N-acetyltransferase [Actinomycetota bacterium]MEC9425365.1 GNAT family N-acetyltransferase [Actinomycetota bacterium]MED5220355.1 GNAT family N-acetyltransferase [Actinomycetota bacterium]MED5233100.1 GNAT family N-acetyltransferase [Actinomycetota bacterium]